MGSHFLLQGIFFTQESNLGLIHCRQILQTFKEEITTVLPDLFQKVEKEGTLPRSTLSKQNQERTNKKIRDHHPSQHRKQASDLVGSAQKCIAASKLKNQLKDQIRETIQSYQQRRKKHQTKFSIYSQLTVTTSQQIGTRGF